MACSGAEDVCSLKACVGVQVPVDGHGETEQRCRTPRRLLEVLGQQSKLFYFVRPV